MNVLVLGGTGTVGSQVVRELLKRGVDVSVLTRDAKKPLAAGARPVAGDLLDPATIRSAFAGRDAVFLLNALSATECHEGLMAVNGCRLAASKKVVYLSVQAAWTRRRISRTSARSSPSRRRSRPRGSPSRSSGRTTSTRTTPGTRTRCSGTTSTRSPSATSACRASTSATSPRSPRSRSRRTRRGTRRSTSWGPDVLTATATASTWGGVLGRKIAYAGNDLDAWEKASLAFMPAFAVFDFRLMYQFFQEKGLKATPRGRREAHDPPRSRAAALRRVRRRDRPRLERLRASGPSR